MIAYDKVSIIIPVYNTALFLRRAVESALKQSYRNIEIIIVNDASTDDSISIAKEIEKYDNRILLIDQKENKGVANSRNIGIAIATGSYISFLDSDDFWHQEKIERQLDFMKNNNSSISCTGYSVIDERNNVIGKLIPPVKSDYFDFLKRCTAGCSTVMYHVGSIKKRYFPVCGHEDYALWLNILKEKYQFDGIQNILSFYTKREKSVSYNKFKNLNYFWYIYRVQEKYSFLRSIFFIARYSLLNRGKYNK